MVVALNPIVVAFGPLAVRWFGLLALVGLALAVWLSVRGLDGQALGRQQTLDALAWGLPPTGAIPWCEAGHMLEHP